MGKRLLTHKVNLTRLLGCSLTLLGAFLTLSLPLQAQTRERHFGPVNLNVERGIRIGVDNRTTGRITVSGWDRDTVEARAVSTRGIEVVVVDHYNDGGIRSFDFIGDYADLDNPGAPNVRLDSPPEVDGKPLKVHLEVRVPRYIQLKDIEVWRSEVEINDLDTGVAVSGDRSKIILRRVNAVRVHTTSGDVEIDGVNELASVVTTAGAIRATRSRKLIVAVSITGPIEVKCSAGRVDVSNTGAPIVLENIDGDVDAIATNSSVRLTSAIREGGRYYLKSMSGRVEMVLPANTRGFEAVLSSYQGSVETDFKFATKLTADGTQNRRVAGRFGNGKAQILLDSFEGAVRLARVEAQSIPTCK